MSQLFFPNSNFKWDDVVYTFIIFVYKKKITKIIWNEKQSVAPMNALSSMWVGEDQEVNELTSQ